MSHADNLVGLFRNLKEYINKQSGEMNKIVIGFAKNNGWDKTEATETLDLMKSNIRFAPRGEIYNYFDKFHNWDDLWDEYEASDDDDYDDGEGRKSKKRVRKKKTRQRKRKRTKRTKRRGRKRTKRGGRRRGRKRTKRRR